MCVHVYVHVCMCMCMCMSILPVISKVYERHLFHQINDFLHSKLSQYQCGFRKGCSFQYCNICLILMLEKWKQYIDKEGSSGSLLTDLSKAFDCLSRDLLIAKLKVYGFSYEALKLIYSHLSMRVRINLHYSAWFEIISGVPQDSILGPLLFNVYLSYLFMFIRDCSIANYADDTTPYALGKDLYSIISKLEDDSPRLFDWLRDNILKANPSKCHLLLVASSLVLVASMNGNLLPNEKFVELLGITIDNELNFNMCLAYVCKQAKNCMHFLESQGM